MLAITRSPAVAGRFYPADSRALNAEIDAFLGEAPTSEPAFAVVAPHAGYLYSGAIAGSVYRRIRVPDNVVVIGPNHTGRGEPVAIMTEGAFEIPGDTIPIARELATRIFDSGVFDRDDLAHRFEHSLEVQLPFLHRRNPELRLVPICLSVRSYAQCLDTGRALARAIEGTTGGALLVASTDMSHYVTADDARRLDLRALERLVALDPEGLYRTVVEHRISMCGFIPTTVALIAAKELGAREAEIVRYGHSGEITGDHSSVVAYAAAIVR